MLCACSLARSIARVDAGDCSPLSLSVLPQSVRPSFLPSLQQIRSNQRVSQLHPLSRAHLQPGDTKDRQAERRAGTRQAHTTGHRASSSVIGDGWKCTKQILPRLLGATQPRKDVEMGLGTEGAQSGLGECTQDKMAIV